MRYPDCTNPDGECASCALANYDRDCHNIPINAIARLRAEAGITQAELARMINKPRQYIYALESGTRAISGISLGIAIQIADALDIEDIRDLLR